MAHRIVQRGQAILVPRFQICATVQKELDDCWVEIEPRCEVQRCPAIFIPHFQIDPAVQQGVDENMSVIVECGSV